MCVCAWFTSLCVVNHEWLRGKERNFNSVIGLAVEKVVVGRLLLNFAVDIIITCNHNFDCVNEKANKLLVGLQNFKISFFMAHVNVSSAFL